MKRIKSLFAAMILCLLFAPVLTVYKAEAANGDVAVNATNFPDSNFRAYVSENIDTDGNGVLSSSECEAVIQMNVAVREITSLKGVEFFTGLQLHIYSLFDKLFLECNSHVLKNENPQLERRINLEKTCLFILPCSCFAMYDVLTTICLHQCEKF